MKALPHRYPFLMVDKIREIRGDDSCIGIKNVTFNEPHFMGHFPEHPVMPGVLLIEGMAQTAGALCVLAQVTDAKPKLVYFMTIDNAKFRTPGRARRHGRVSREEGPPPIQHLEVRRHRLGRGRESGGGRSKRHAGGRLVG